MTAHETLLLLRTVFLVLALGITLAVHRAEIVRTVRRCSSRGRQRLEQVVDEATHYFRTEGQP